MTSELRGSSKQVSPHHRRSLSALFLIKPFDNWTFDAADQDSFILEYDFKLAVKIIGGVVHETFATSKDSNRYSRPEDSL
jgi:hypothetical protein